MKGRKLLAKKGLIALAIMAACDLAVVFGYIPINYIFLVVVVNVIGAIFIFSMFMGLLYYARVARARRVSAEFDEADRIEQNKKSDESPDADIQSLYRELVKKYHPDFARSEEDKKFRTDLTAKINRAYEAGDIETLRMFQ